MPGFTLPETQATNTAAFSDALTATAWLGSQPQANAPAMLAELLIQIEAFNTFSISPRERFKVMEALRKTIFAVSGECQRRYEGKPLPLLSSEQTMLEWTQRLWRTCTVGYLHCLQACQAQDPGIAGEGARVVHRVLTCLRMEQMAAYLASTDPGAEFWGLLHAVWSCAEKMGVTHEPVVDRLLAETSESTVSGQYCMAVLLHLACPFSLSRTQFAAACRWLARWRELAKVLVKADERPKSCCIALDLAQGRPIHEAAESAQVARWISVGAILRKMSQRLELLAAGELPEILKLGSGLSSEACVALLNLLCERFHSPLSTAPESVGEVPPALVAVGLDNLYRLLGGTGLKDPAATPSFGSKLSADQIAVFGHVVRTQEKSGKVERWLIVRQAPGVLNLLRSPDCGDSRLAFRSLLAFQMPAAQTFELGVVSSVCARNKKDRADENSAGLSVSVIRLAGDPQPVLAEIREKSTGRTSVHPAFLLPAQGEQPASVVLPASLHARAASIRFLDGREQAAISLQLSTIIERGSDHERWSCTDA